MSLFVLWTLQAHAGDVARADALLVQAQALVAAAREELAAPVTNDAPQPGAIDLTSFAWAGGRTADPDGLPTGGKYGEGVESGKRCCQWSWGGSLILHAWFPASAKTATGGASFVRWYHFTNAKTDGGEPWPGLAAKYLWKATSVATDQKTGTTWRRWAGAGVVK